MEPNKGFTLPRQQVYVHIRTKAGKIVEANHHIQTRILQAVEPTPLTFSQIDIPELPYRSEIGYHAIIASNEAVGDRGYTYNWGVGMMYIPMPYEERLELEFEVELSILVDLRPEADALKFGDGGRIVRIEKLGRDVDTEVPERQEVWPGCSYYAAWTANLAPYLIIECESDF